MALVIALAFIVPAGHFTIDEAHYHLMADRLVDAFRFDIPNRLDATAPPELIPYLAVESDGTIVPQYPHLYAFLAAPFYFGFGLRGLFLLNAIAYAALVAATYLIALRLYRDRMVGMIACCILAFATFSLEYALAIWPHALASAFVAFAVLSALVSNDRSGGRAGLLWAAGAGACLGVGIGVRLDVVFAALAVAGCLMLAPRWISRGIACAAAAVPGLAALAAVNAAKFGTMLPFSYGGDGGGFTGDVGQYVPVVATLVLVVGFAAAVPAVRDRGHGLADSRAGIHLLRFGAVLGGLALAASAILIGPRLLHGLSQIVVDLRFMPPDHLEPGMVRTADGAVFYFDRAKKALLQSCPFLLVAALDALRQLRHPDERRATLALLFPIAAYVCVFSYFAWQGGLSFNMRYLTPALPFIAILTARTFAGLLGELHERARRIMAWLWPVSAVMLSLAVLGGAGILDSTAGGLLENPDWARRHTFWMLTVPLWLAVAAAACWSVYRVAAPAWRPRAATAAAAALSVTLGWGAFAGLIHDLANGIGARAVHSMEADWIEAQVRPESLLIADYDSHLYDLLAERGVHVGLFRGRDPSASLRHFARPYAQRGRDAYLFGAQALVERLGAQGALDQIRLEPVGTYHSRTLYRIRLAAPEPAGGGLERPAAASAIN